MTNSWNLKVNTSEFMRINRELASYFRRRMPRKETADLVAEAWLGIVRWYNGKAPLRVFAFLVARTIVSNFYRRPRLVTIPLLGDARATEGPGLDSLLMLAAGHEALERALEQVADSYRDVVRLWLLGRDNMQIAAELDIPYNTVRSKLSRGQAQARAALRAEFEVA